METKVNSGAIFKNEKKSENHPDYRGTINVDGQDKEIALWVKQSAKGVSYFFVKISEPYKKAEQPIQATGKWIKPEETNDLPFQLCTQTTTRYEGYLVSYCVEKHETKQYKK